MEEAFASLTLSTHTAVPLQPTEEVVSVNKNNRVSILLLAVVVAVLGVVIFRTAMHQEHDQAAKPDISSTSAAEPTVGLTQSASSLHESAVRTPQCAELVGPWVAKAELHMSELEKSTNSNEDVYNASLAAAYYAKAQWLERHGVCLNG